MRGEMVIAIGRHYRHACEKHPYFCDLLGPDPSKPADCKRAEARLKIIRACVKDAIKRGNVDWAELLDCEVWEVFDALAKGDKAAAVSECYDAIAVLLRVVDVLEGRQKLGKPDAKGEAK